MTTKYCFQCISNPEINNMILRVKKTRCCHSHRINTFRQLLFTTDTFAGCTRVLKYRLHMTVLITAVY